MSSKTNELLLFKLIYFIGTFKYNISQNYNGYKKYSQIKEFGSYTDYKKIRLSE